MKTTSIVATPYHEPLAVTCRAEGKDLDYRVFASNADTDEEISLWHDVPLFTSSSQDTVNFICEIPKWSRKKFEISTTEKGNPIKQDEKKGVLREFKRGDMQFNYGCLPQTWEDPAHISEDTGVGGDNDPLDVCEIGMRAIPTGGVRAVKVLGVLAMIDDGETDWKVVAIDASDPWAEKLNDINDVEAQIPGLLDAMREWFRLYKVPDGKPENKFGLDEKFMNREYTMKVVMETHQFWCDLVLGERSDSDSDDDSSCNDLELPVQLPSICKRTGKAKVASRSVHRRFCVATKKVVALTRMMRLARRANRA